MPRRVGARRAALRRLVTVGDVNDEESTWLVLEMCGIAIAPGDLGPRECAVGLTVLPNGAMEPLMETYAERTLMLRVKENYPRGRGGCAGGQAGERLEAEAACGGGGERGGTVSSTYL